MKTASTWFEFSSKSWSMEVEKSRVQAREHETCPNKSLRSLRPATNRKKYFTARDPASCSDHVACHGDSLKQTPRFDPGD